MRRSGDEAQDGTREIAVVGLGPRGLSVVERLSANAPGCLPEGLRVRLHLVDPHLMNGSRVWRTGQSAELLMNTVTSQITLFVDDTVECAGPVVPGPSLYEWCRRLAAGGGPSLPPDMRAEALRLGPDSYPSRALYGHYLSWVLRHLVAAVPPAVTVVPHCQEAVRLTDDPDGRQTLTMQDGSALSGLEAVVLTPGHLNNRPTRQDQRFTAYAERHGLTYVAPCNPADADLDRIAPGQPIALRGLGLNFFDYMALFTTGRGGGFEPVNSGGLRYVPSGAEPRMIAGSRRGVPYHARGENEKGAFGRHTPLFLTQNVIADLRARAEAGAPVDFSEEVWPLVDAEVRAVYYATLIGGRTGPADAAEFLGRYVELRAASGAVAPGAAGPLGAEPPAAEKLLLDRYAIAEAERWDWLRIARPYGDRRFSGPRDFRAWLLDHLAQDVREARRGNVSGPLKAALDVMRDLRNEIRLVVDHGGLSGDSYRNDLQGWYTPLNAFVSIGPPVERIEQMIALIEAGLLTVLGPGMTVDCGPGGVFTGRATTVPGSGFRATALIEARLPETDIHQTSDVLFRSLLADGGCTHYRIPIRGGGWYETGGLAVTRRPYHLLDAQRRPHERRFAFGVPTETAHWVTAAGVRPGVNSVILSDADSVARAGLRLAAHGPRADAERNGAEPAGAERAASEPTGAEQADAERTG